MPERKSCSAELKTDDSGSLEAIFANLETKDHDDDWTLPGAFPSGAEVPLTAYGHGSYLYGALPIGKGRIVETKSDARFQGRFFLQTEHGKNAYETIKALGPLQEYSYEYEVAERGELTEELRGKGVRRVLQKVKVLGVSPVLAGAGIATGTVSVKGFDASAPFGDQMIALEIMEQLCPACAGEMKRLGFAGVRLKQMPEAMLKGLCETFGVVDGFRTRCMDSALGGAIEDTAAFCNWLKSECGLQARAAELKATAERELREAIDAAIGQFQRTRRQYAD